MQATTQAPATSLFTSLHAQLSQAVLACRADAAKRAVHNLRTTTRRLEGLLHKSFGDHPDAAELHKASRKTLRQLKKLRQLAGPVRDLDVHHKLAEEILKHPAFKADDVDSLNHQWQQLEKYLKQKRDKAAEDLQAGLAKREIRLERALERTAAALEPISESSTDALTTARRWVERSARHLGQLSKQNLHDFRKETKLARYVSEMQPPSQVARSFTQNLLAIQDAIGAWHDRDLLHEEARDVCGKHAELTRLFAEDAQAALKKALAKAAAIPRSGVGGTA